MRERRAGSMEWTKVGDGEGGPERKGWRGQNREGGREGGQWGGGRRRRESMRRSGRTEHTVHLHF